MTLRVLMPAFFTDSSVVRPILRSDRASPSGRNQSPFARLPPKTPCFGRWPVASRALPFRLLRHIPPVGRKQPREYEEPPDPSGRSIHLLVGLVSRQSLSSPMVAARSPVPKPD